jgi:type I restriction enzyme S subunit
MTAMNEYRLEQLFDLQMGKTPSRNESSYWLNGLHDWISIRDLSNSSKYISETNEKLSDIAVKESGIRIILKDTVIMSFKLSIGKVAITSHDMYSNEAIMAFHDKKVVEILPEYLYYLLLAKNWDEGSNKAVMGITLNKATLSMIKIRMHDIVNQVQITSVLDNLDKQINNKKKQITEYDQLIKSRFVEMFGDPILNQKGWNSEKLQNVCPVNKYKGEVENISGKVWLLNLDMIESNTGKIIDYVYEYENKIASSTIKFDTNCVLYSKLRPYLNKVVVPSKSGYATSEMISIKTDNINKYFLSNLLMMNSFVDFANGTSYGAKMPRASVDMIKDFDLMLPPKSLQDDFGLFVEQVDKLKFEDDF